MNNPKDIARALRCSAAPKGCDCTGCVYRVLEKVKPEYPIPASVVIDGVGYWESCDVDAMVLDAAEWLERMEGNK